MTLRQENAELRKRVAEFEGLLREIQWTATSQGVEGLCPVCFASEEIGHAADCRLAAALLSLNPSPLPPAAPLTDSEEGKP